MPGEAPRDAWRQPGLPAARAIGAKGAPLYNIVICDRDVHLYNVNSTAYPSWLTTEYAFYQL